MIFTGKTWVFHFGALFWNTEAEATSGRARRTSSFLNVSNSNWLHCVHNEKANNIDPGVCYRQHSKRRERHRKKNEPKPNRNRNRTETGGGDVVEVCDLRPKYTYNFLDAVVVDTVEFLYRTTCNLTTTSTSTTTTMTTTWAPFADVFACFADVLDAPSLVLEWTYVRALPPVVGLANYFCS